MTQKKLIDYCNSTPWHHCMNGCPYENKECDAYGRKYNCNTPAYDNDLHPERYTDDEIVMEDSSDE